MHYEINVSLNGQHVFATHQRSLTTEEQTARLYVLLADTFKPSEGYKLRVTRRYEVCADCTQDIVDVAHELRMLAKEGTS